MKLKMVHPLVCGLAVFFTGSTAWAQNWAEKMFDKLEHDFGVVARGADTRYRIMFTNKYLETVHISDIRKSCGCTSATPSATSIKSLERAWIEFTMDTKKFTHQKDSAVTIVFDQPQYAEVRIPVKAFIRTDVVLTPGGAEFGPVTRGNDVERKLAVAYAGRDSWSIKDVISKNPNIVAKAKETSRGGGRVNYDLLVTIKGSMPAGDFRDQVTLVTDDAGNPYVPVMVEGKVENEYSVTPELVDFGTMAPGAKKSINVIVRSSSKKPFTIDKIEAEKSDGTFEVTLSGGGKPIHVIPLTLVAPEQPGSIADEFTVTINGNNSPVTFKAVGKVVAATTTQTSALKPVEVTPAPSGD